MIFRLILSGARGRTGFRNLTRQLRLVKNLVENHLELSPSR